MHFIWGRVTVPCLSYVRTFTFVNHWQSQARTVALETNGRIGKIWVFASAASSYLLTVVLIPPRSLKMLVLKLLLFLSWHRVRLLQLWSRPGTKQTARFLPKEQKVLVLYDKEGLSLGALQLLSRHKVTSAACILPSTWTGMWICRPLSDCGTAVTLSLAPTTPTLHTADRPLELSDTEGHTPRCTHVQVFSLLFFQKLVCPSLLRTQDLYLASHCTYTRKLIGSPFCNHPLNFILTVDKEQDYWIVPIANKGNLTTGETSFNLLSVTADFTCKGRP